MLGCVAKHPLRVFYYEPHGSEVRAREALRSSASWSRICPAGSPGAAGPAWVGAVVTSEVLPRAQRQTPDDHPNPDPCFAPVRLGEVGEVATRRTVAPLLTAPDGVRDGLELRRRDALAATVGGAVTRQQLIDYEAGARRPDPPRLVALAEALQVPPEYLAGIKPYRADLADLRHWAGLTAELAAAHLGFSR